MVLIDILRIILSIILVADLILKFKGLIDFESTPIEFIAYALFYISCLVCFWV